MTRVLIILFSGLVAYGCAAVDEPIPATVSAAPTPVPTATPTAPAAPIASPQEPSVDDAPTVIASTSTAAGTELPSTEPPPVERSEFPVVVSNKNERVCRREKRTGSNRAMRVCRTRAEVERLEEEGKDTFRELHRSQMGEK